MSVRVEPAVLLFLAAYACKDTPPTPSSRATPAPHAAPLSSVGAHAAPTASPPASPSRVATGELASEYRGAIGGGAAVVARLHAAGEHVTGSYFYEKTGGTLTISGSRIGAHLTLDELGDRKAKSGAIEADVGPDGTLQGTWSDATGQRSLPLILRPIPAASSAASALVFRRRSREVRTVVGAATTGATCKTDLEYAEVFGLPPAIEARINARLAPPQELTMPEPCDHAVESTLQYRVEHNADGILSARATGSLTDSMAAHPDAVDTWLTLFLATGADVKLFGDIFDAKAEPVVRRELATVVDEAARHDAWDAETKQMVTDGFGTLDGFVITGAGLRLCTSVPHVVAAFGGCQYLVPAARLPRTTPGAVALWAQ